MYEAEKARLEAKAQQKAELFENMQAANYDVHLCACVSLFRFFQKLFAFLIFLAGNSITQICNGAEQTKSVLKIAKLYIFLIKNSFKICSVILSCASGWSKCRS